MLLKEKENQSGEESVEGSEDSESEEKEDLEAAISREGLKGMEGLGPKYQGPFEAFAPNAEYVAELSREPAADLYQRMEGLRNAIEDRGYMTMEEQQQASNIYSAIETKLQDVESGNYSVTEDVARVAMFTKQVTGRLLDESYQKNKDVRDEYKVDDYKA